VQPGLVLDRADVRLEHHVEVARLGPLAFGAAARARDLGQPFGQAVFAVLELLLEGVGAEPLVALETFGERIREHADVAGGDPHLTRQDHRRVEPDDVVAGGDDLAPPLLLDVLLELDAQGAVVPRRTRAAVDLATGEDEAPPLGEADDVVPVSYTHLTLPTN